MKKTKVYKYKDLFPILMIFFGLFSYGCKSRISGNAAQNATPSVYANPETIQFTATDRAKMFKQLYLKLGYQFPPQAQYDAIAKAADNDAAKAAYDAAIEDLVNSDVLKDSLLDFFTKILGVGDPIAATNLEPALLGTYVVLDGKSIKEFFLADYGYDSSGNIIDPSYTNGPPKSAMAGFMTTQAYFNNWINQFGFKWIREVLSIGLNDLAPFPRSKLYSWEASNLAPKYLAATTNNVIFCEGCHRHLNAYRGALHGYDLTNKTWLGTYVQGTNQFTEELNDSSGLEPRSSGGSPIAAATAEKMYKLVDNGSALKTPKDLAKQIVEHENFPAAWAERLIVYALGLPPGSPGAPPTIPNYFSGSEAKEKFMGKWAAKLQDNKFIARTFLQDFFTSPDYLVTGYVDPNATPEAP